VWGGVSVAHVTVVESFVRATRPVASGTMSRAAWGREGGGRTSVTKREMQRLVRARRTTVLLVFDVVALAVGYLFATWVRSDGLPAADLMVRAAVLGLCGGLLMTLVGLLWRVYQGRVAVASIEETLHLAGLATISGLVIFLANVWVDPSWVPRSVPVSGTALGLLAMLVTRAAWRYQSDHVFVLDVPHARRTVVVGAGYSGSRLVRSMLSRPESGFLPVAFVDDDPWKRRRSHYRIPVMGTLEELPEVVANTNADAVVVAIPSASKDLLKPLAEQARVAGIDLKVLPTFAESFADKADVRDIRDVNLHDILGRAAIETDVAAIAGYVTGKRVLVTGAGGSIGSELCRQLDHFGPAELMMLDRDESALHGVQLSIRGQALLDSEEVVLNDIRDLEALRRVFQERRPEVVFHAAALKHLPMLEQYPYEAMKTNVLGTANVLEVACEVGVETFVNISTDKAADPKSVLGYSKRIAERLTASMSQRADGTYISVRFGNVLGSRGSVLHTFTAQIAAGGPVTVVHPDVTRYFMTVEEAVQLVIQAGSIGENGEVMILDMGEPVKILDVAHQLIAQSGKDIEVLFTGLREGEKLHEQLFGGSEDDERSKHPMVSHAEVAPLSVDVVRAHDLHGTHLGMLQAFEDWVHLPDPTLVEDDSEREPKYERVHAESAAS